MGIGQASPQTIQATRQGSSFLAYLPLLLVPHGSPVVLGPLNQDTIWVESLDYSPPRLIPSEGHTCNLVQAVSLLCGFLLLVPR